MVKLLVQKGMEKSMSAVDGLLDGIGNKIKGFITNPLTIATGLLLTFNAQQKAIADQFGAIGVTEFRQELATANKEFVRLGFSGAEAQKTISGFPDVPLFSHALF